MAGLTGDDVDFTAGFHRAMLISAALTVVGAVIAFFTVPGEPLQGSDEAEGLAEAEDDDLEADRVPCPPGMPGCPPVDVEVPVGATEAGTDSAPASPK